MLEEFNYRFLFAQYIKELLSIGITISCSEFAIIEKFWTYGFSAAIKDGDINFAEKNPGLNEICYMSYDDGHRIGLIAKEKIQKMN